MSRIGRMPIAIPAGVTVTVDDAAKVITVKGPKGTLTESYNALVDVKVEGAEIVVTRRSDENMDKAIHGTTRANIANMVNGVANGFVKRLEIVGVGYKAAKQGKTLVLNLGHSHPIKIDEADGISYTVTDSIKIDVCGIDKQKVGQAAAVIRSKRPPEPYHGKGVKYADEVIRRKVGKASGK